MKSIFGLETRYYVRHLLIALALSVVFMQFMSLAKINTDPFFGKIWFGVWVFFGISSLLYPFARYAYGALWRLMRGDNDSVWLVGGALLVIIYMIKLQIRWLLLLLAIFIAPIGWLIVKKTT